MQAGPGEPGPGGRGWGVGGAEPGWGGEGTSGGSDGLGLGEERRSGEEALELLRRGLGVRVGDAERPS